MTNFCPNGEYHDKIKEKTCLFRGINVCPYEDFRDCSLYQERTRKIATNTEEGIYLVDKVGSA
ncbi:MAG: hypothetical protein WC413_02320 [Candidatus Nanoarchaeia archaeon]